MKMKFFKTLMVSCVLAFVGQVSAHDGGHGPKVSDVGSFGGVITAVIEAKDASKGAVAPLVYKGELIRSADKTVRIYIYGKDMKLLPAMQLSSKAEAKIITMVGGKETVTPFTLMFENNAYVGKMSEPAGKPYNIDVTFKADHKDLLAAFDNLD